MRSLALNLLLGLAVATAPAYAAGKAKVAAGDPNKVICKRSEEIGSLIARKKQCFTRAEWDQLSQAARAGGQDMVDRNAGRPPGN